MEVAKSSIGGALLCAAILALITACGGSSKRGAPAATNTQGSPDPFEAGGGARTFDDPREEIDFLHSEITTLRRNNGMTDMPSIEDPAPEMLPQPMAANGDFSDTCSDVCTLAASICDNAGRICRLADALAPDDWAEEKCTSADASCTEANDNCTECNG